MNSSVLECFENGLRAARAGRDHGWTIRVRGGEAHHLPLHRWTGHLVDGDDSLVRMCHGTTLDVGCGPGRITEALALRGIPVLGIDIAAEAVRQTRHRGAEALRRDVFGALPGQGRWRHVVLADGNVGIGADPYRLLARVHELLCAGGTAVCEAAPPGTGLHRIQVRLERDRLHSAWFWWAEVGTVALAELAPAAGFSVSRVWTEAHRWFIALARR